MAQKKQVKQASQTISASKFTKQTSRRPSVGVVEQISLDAEISPNMDINLRPRKKSARN